MIGLSSLLKYPSNDFSEHGCASMWLRSRRPSAPVALCRAPRLKRTTLPFIQKLSLLDHSHPSKSTALSYHSWHSYSGTCLVTSFPLYSKNFISLPVAQRNLASSTRRSPACRISLRAAVMPCARLRAWFMILRASLLTCSSCKL